MIQATHYIQFLGPAGETLADGQRYQSFFINETRTFNGEQYAFSPFTISGDISTDGSESGDYELVAPANAISNAKLWQASKERYLIRINTVLLVGQLPLTENGIPAWSELNFLSSTICVCDSFGYADSVPGEEDQFSLVTLRLTNPLNFVAGSSPTRRLTAAQVGPLPSSGGITF